MEETRQQKRARTREAKRTKNSQDKKLSRIVGGLVDGKPYDKWPAWEGRGVPVRENCDPTNPRQAFLWMFTAMPGMKGAPLMLPTEYWETQSWRMWVLGARPVAEPTLKYRAPASVTAAWQAAGEWVNLDAPDRTAPSFAELFRDLPQQERAEIRAALLGSLGLDDGDKPGPPAMQYTVGTLAERLGRSPEDLAEVLANIGVTNVHADSRVSREVADRIAEHLGLQ